MLHLAVHDQVWNNLKPWKSSGETTSRALLAWTKMFPKTKWKRATNFITSQFDYGAGEGFNIWEVIFKMGTREDGLAEENLGVGPLMAPRGSSWNKDIFKSGNFQILLL